MSVPAPNDDHPDQITWTRFGDLLASLPYLLGYQPNESLVMLALDQDSSTLVVVDRVDLPSPNDYWSTAARLASSVTARRPLRIFLVVIAVPSSEPGVPHRALIEACVDELERAGLPVIEAWWTPLCTAAAPWRSYNDPDTSGIVPEPAKTSLAAQSVLAGRVTYASRDDMAALLAPAPDRVLARRTELLASLTAAHRPHAADRYRRFYDVDDSVHRAHAGDFPITDNEVAQLTLALRDHMVRDACLLYIEGEFWASAEKLWRYLVRAVPGPDRAEPAVLLALWAYLRGDDVLAQIALQRAHESTSSHRLTAVVAETLAYGVPPERLRRVVIRTGIKALDKVMKSAP